MDEVWKEPGATLTQCLGRQSQLSAHISTAKRAGPQLRGEGPKVQLRGDS